jgi:hypothetical protein
LEAVISVITLAYAKRVLLPEVGLVTVGGNAVTVAGGVLFLFFGLSFGCSLLSSPFFRLGGLLFFLCAFFLWPCRFFRFRFLLVLGLGFRFFLLVILCERRDCDSERQG